MADREQFTARDNIARAFADLYRTQHQEFPPEARDSDYEQRLREARMTIFKNQEARRQRALQARAAAVAEARSLAQTQVQRARDAIEKEKIAAQVNLEADSRRLATDIIRMVLQPTSEALAGGE